jgi:hypothetical protein
MRTRSLVLALPVILILSTYASAAPRAGKEGKELNRDRSSRIMEQSKGSEERRGTSTDTTTADAGLPASKAVISEEADFVGPKATPAQFQNSVLQTLAEMRSKPEVTAAADVADAIQSNPDAIKVVANGWMTTCKNLSTEALNNGLRVLAVGARNVALAPKEVYKKGLKTYKDLTGQGKESFCQLRQGQQCALFAGPLVAGCI